MSADDAAPEYVVLEYIADKDAFEKIPWTTLIEVFIKMSFRIITDSASDIPQETAQKWGIKVMPIHTRFGDEEYLDGVTLKPPQFFEKLVGRREIPGLRRSRPLSSDRSLP